MYKRETTETGRKEETDEHRDGQATRDANEQIGEHVRKHNFFSRPGLLAMTRRQAAPCHRQKKEFSQINGTLTHIFLI